MSLVEGASGSTIGHSTAEAGLFLASFAQDRSQTTFAYLQERRLHNLSVQYVPVLDCMHSEKVFSAIQREPAVFHFMPISTSVARHC